MNKTPEQSERAKQFLEDAYKLDDLTGIDGFYSKWATEYDDQMLSGLGYLSPTLLASLLLEYSANATPVLDIGCGTGLTAHALAEVGFTDMDGLDYSGPMLKVAADRGIYRKLIQADLNLPLQLEDDSYAAVVSTGTFTHGHVGPEPLKEIARILMPAGLLLCTIHFDLWTAAGFDSEFERLEESGILKCLAKTPGKFFQDGNDEGWFCVFQKGGS